MECYDEFIRRQAIHIRMNVGEKPEQRISQPSTIRFHGLPILPPMVTVLEFLYCFQSLLQFTDNKVDLLKIYYSVMPE